MKLGVFVCWRGHATKLQAKESQLRLIMSMPCATCKENAPLTDVMTLEAPKERRAIPAGWRVVDGSAASAKRKG